MHQKKYTPNFLDSQELQGNILTKYCYYQDLYYSGFL